MPDVLADVPATLVAFLDTATDKQRDYLVARCGASQHAALKAADAAYDTLERTWRPDPAFKAAEQCARTLAADQKTVLARSIAQGAAALVVTRQVAQATESHIGRSDRELMAQQRARAAVLDIAGLTHATVNAGDVERVDVIAARLWMRRKPQDAPIA